MDYSFGNEQVKATVKAVAEKIKEKEEKDNA